MLVGRLPTRPRTFYFFFILMLAAFLFFSFLVRVWGKTLETLEFAIGRFSLF
ncbi:hypothetical protein GIB67_003170 [Kingdonia uniflora]|uniref:Uncharacterized protein n=1 Tax=Kingdonia uniflora TaxID=39325 RepID=A0A7J7N6G7_9MAGN|nr:hypothetical protein GIB67_003170 [Kingdonia uniflora]